jgi:hypothetical protein
MFLKNKKFFIVSFALLLIIPVIADAQGLVPCGHGSSISNACTLCHLIIGIKNLTSFGLGLLITVGAVAIFIAGVMYIVATGNEQAMSAAKSFLGASLKGFAIVLMAWFFVNIVMWLLSFNNKLQITQTNWYSFTCSTVSSGGRGGAAATQSPSTPTGGGGGGGW